MKGIQITDLERTDHATIRQIAQILLEAFAHIPGWVSTIEEGIEEVNASLAPSRISRVALVDGQAVGWIGGIPEYEGNCFELHPLAVKPTHQRQGVGTALVRDLEAQARRRGATTVYLGTDDEFGGTTLFGTDVYPNVLEHLGGIRNLNNHPYEFYQKCGYVIVGMIPDANGPGKPDIFMAKRVGSGEISPRTPPSSRGGHPLVEMTIHL